MATNTNLTDLNVMGETSELRNLDINQFKQFSRDFVDEFTGQSRMKDYEIKNIDNAKCELVSLLRSAVYDGLDNPLIQSYGEDIREVLSQIYEDRKVDVVLKLLKEHNSKCGPVLDNFDWKLKWVLSSSTSINLRYPIVELILNTVQRERDELVRKSITLELTKDELNLLLNALKSVNTG